MKNLLDENLSNHQAAQIGKELAANLLKFAQACKQNK